MKQTSKCPLMNIKDLPTGNLPEGAKVVLAFDRLAADHWKGRDFSVVFNAQL